MTYEKGEVAELLERVLAGDSEARAHFCAESLPVVRRAVELELNRLPGAPLGAADRDDLSSEIMARLLADDCRLLRKLREPRSIAAWLVTLSRNHVRDHIRKSATRGRVHDEAAREPRKPYGDTPADGAMAEERRAIIRRAMGELPDKDRLILQLYYMHGMKYVEIADMLDLNINTLSARLRRARERLRKLMEARIDD